MSVNTQPQQILVYPESTQHSSEINLVEVFRILSKRKKLFITIFLMIMLTGLAVAFFKPAKYEYASVIKIGKIEQNTGDGIIIKLIEDVESALSKLENAYLPKITAEMQEQHPDSAIPGVKITIPKGSQTILLSSKATMDDPFVIDIQKRLANMLTDEHAAEINKKIQRIDYNINLKKIRIKQLMNEKWQASGRLKIANKIKQIESEKKKLNNTIVLKKEELKNLNKIQSIKRKQQMEISKQIIKFRAIQLNFIEAKNSETQALLSKAMINSEIQRLLDKANEIELYLQTIANERKQSIENTIIALQLQLEEMNNTKTRLTADLEHLELNLKNQIEVMKLELKQLEINKKNFQLTSLVTPPQNTGNKVGAGRLLIIILSFVLGLFIALISVFIYDYYKKLQSYSELV